MTQLEVQNTINDIIKSFQPVFTAHGGGAEVAGVDADLAGVTLRILGHCNGCALAPLTFGLGIEKLIREKIPTIKEVRYTD
jgi:Fe-S cluster biogenesis protein NfuA